MNTNDIKSLLRSRRQPEPSAQLDARVDALLSARQASEVGSDGAASIDPAFFRLPFGWQDWCYATLGLLILPTMALSIWLLLAAGPNRNDMRGRVVKQTAAFGSQDGLTGPLLALCWRNQCTDLNGVLQDDAIASPGDAQSPGHMPGHMH